jgi:hypothetical protein
MSTMSAAEARAALSSERKIHTAIVDYLNAVLPDSHMTVHLYNNPRSAAAGAAAKRMGMLAGIPDLMIIRPLGRIVFIEVKKEGGRLNPAQIAFRLFCRQWGVHHAVCRSIADVRDFLAEIGIETKGARAA